MKTLINKIIIGGLLGLASFAVFLLCGSQAEAAVLTATPDKAQVNVGDTFTVQISLDTEGASVNTIDVRLQYPPDKLQVTSPSSGNSIIEIYTTPPKFNNQVGTIQFAGGIPGGISAKNGLIATITFRAKSPGSAVIRFGDASKALLNDGQGTDVLSKTQSGVVSLGLPPPGGPNVQSDTHPNSDSWYRNKTVSLGWGHSENVQGYSFMVNDQPVDTPDDISEGMDESITYRTLPDGIHYFHIRALREGKWGGTTHFAFKIDSTGPAEFPLEIIPRARTIVRQPIIHFTTTDSLSGVARYEIKLVPLNQKKSEGEEFLFVEATSPYTPSQLELGSYEIILRAYDNAGNYRESNERLEITRINAGFLGRAGFEIRNVVTVSWGALAFILLVTILLLVWILRKVRKWHHAYKEDIHKNNLPGHIKDQLDQLKKYQRRYGKLASILLILVGSLVFFDAAAPAEAVEAKLVPATITSFSDVTTDEELFFVSGRTDDPETEVIINVQNTLLSDTYTHTTVSDKRGDWSFRSENPLRYGSYAIWVQSKLGDQLSPPSPQVTMIVHKVAFNLAGSRVTYLVAYLVAIVILIIIVCVLLGYIIYHSLQGHSRRREFVNSLELAEESIKRGFAMLRRDIQAELALVSEASLSPEIKTKGKVREKRLLEDLKYVEEYVGKEIWQTKQYEKKK